MLNIITTDQQKLAIVHLHENKYNIKQIAELLNANSSSIKWVIDSGFYSKYKKILLENNNPFINFNEYNLFKKIHITIHNKQHMSINFIHYLESLSKIYSKITTKPKLIKILNNELSYFNEEHTKPILITCTKQEALKNIFKEHTLNFKYIIE